MKDVLFEQLIILYVVSHIEHLRNGYNLIKILSRKFDIIDFRRVKNILVKKQYLTETIINQIGHYAITHEGEIFLKEYLDELKRELKETYLPKDPNYIQAILSHIEDYL